MEALTAGPAKVPGPELPGPELPGLLPSRLLDQPETGRYHLDRSARDWIVDLTAFLISVGFIAHYWPWRAGAPPFPESAMIANVVLGVLASIALWFRRRWPVALVIGLIPASVFAETAGGAIMVALFTVAVHRRYQVAVLFGVIHGLLGVPYFALHPDPEFPYWGIVAIFWALTAVVVTWGMFVRARRQLVLSLQDRAMRAETEQRLRVEQARQVERTRIAREMHDVLAHRISLLSMHAGALEFRPDAPAEEIARMAGIIRASSHQALQDLREVINVLREPQNGAAPTSPQPTLADLPALVDESRQAGMRIRSRNRVQGHDQPPESIGRSAYRVTQEALTNARKHAPGVTVDLSVDGGPGQGLTIEIVNALPVGRTPCPPIPGTGTGLIGLSERVALIGGRIVHGPTDEGFRVWAWLPWPL